MGDMGPICVSAVLLFMFAEYEMASGISSDCDRNQTFILSCENIHTSMGFTYHVPNNVKMRLTDDCEHGWYYLNGTFIADSTDITKSGFVKNLTISTCENLIWESNCANNAVPRTCISFSILEQSKSTNDSQTGNKTCSEDCNPKKDLNVLPPLMIALIVIAIVIVIVVGGFVAVWKYCHRRGKGSNGVV